MINFGITHVLHSSGVRLLVIFNLFNNGSANYQ
jgi:hypothetical protein